MKIKLLYFLSVLFLVACGYQNDVRKSLENEDKDAKQMLQGIWLGEDEETPVWFVKNDSILFPDTTSMSAKFWIYKDSLYLESSHLVRYKIVKQAENLFKFINQMGEEVKLIKSEDLSAKPSFYKNRSYALNILRIYDTDTVGIVGDVRYECSIHIEPTSDRIIKSNYTDEGVEVDNLYLDNIARVKVRLGSVEVLSREFHKSDFSKFVPFEFMSHSILRDVVYSHADSIGAYFDAIVGIPDASTCYVVEMKVWRNGKLSMRLR